MSKLSERTLLVSVHRSGWAGAKVDQEVSEDARSRRNAERGAGRFTKILVKPDFFKCVTTPISQADAVWKRLSLPWGSNGDRIMSTMAYPPFQQEIHAAKLLVEKGKTELRSKEYFIHEEARKRLGYMYNSDEYPHIDEIVDRFGIDVEINPVPEGGDFRTKLSDATVRAMERDLEQRNKERLTKAANEVFRRVHNVVETLTKTLKEYQPKTDTSKGRNFKNSLVENVREVAELLPTLNINADPRLDNLRDELIDTLTMVPPEILKNNMAAREKITNNADALLAKVAGFMA
jgi:hypothetical protein